jgi:hypothetical protein
MLKHAKGKRKRCDVAMMDNEGNSVDVAAQFNLHQSRSTTPFRHNPHHGEIDAHARQSKPSSLELHDQVTVACEPT